MASWNLSDIINKIRLTTGRPDPSMMSDATITNYVNNFYQFVLPKELKIFWGYTYYEFFTQANIDQYTAPTNFQTLNPQVWADGFPIEWYISPDTFYQDWPEQLNKAVVAQGNGAPGQTFAFFISAYPVLPRSVYVESLYGSSTYPSSQVAVDNGVGGFYDFNTYTPLTGSIDYTTGTVSGLQFLNDPLANTNVTVTSMTYMPNRPQGILYFKSTPLFSSSSTAINDQEYFVLRPVPDQTYKIKMQGIQVPVAMSTSNVTAGVYTDVPFRTDLGPLIAYGASLEIFADFDQMGQYQEILVQYNRYKDVSMQDTYEEYLYQRSVPAF